MTTETSSTITARWARASAVRPRRTLAAWGVAVAAALLLAASSLHGLTSHGHVSGSAGSRKAAAAIATAFPPTPAERRHEVSDVVVFSSPRLTAEAPRFRAAVSRLVAAVRASGEAFNVHSYLEGDAGLVSRDRHAALIQLGIASDAAAKPIEQLVKRSSAGPFAAAITGEHSIGADMMALSQRDLRQSELAFGLPVALLVLMLVFGALVAGLVPLTLAVISIVVGLGVVALLSLGFSLSVFIVNMLTAMGLALGIDYSLFVVSRYREERALGLAKEDAIARAGATASRAVLFSGGTFVVALVGMFLVPTNVMRSLAAGAIIVGAVSVLAALTLLPALLSILGDRVNALRIPLLGRNVGHTEGAEDRLWRRIVETVLRRPALSLGLSVAVMLAAAVPLLGLHIGASGVSTLPGSTPSKQGYLALQRAFPAQNPAAVQVIALGGNAGVGAEVLRLQRRLAGDPRFGTGMIERSPSARAALLSVPVRGDDVAGPAIRAVRELRAHVIPALFAGSGAQVYVGGKTAENADYFDAETGPTPWVFLFVLGLSFLVITVAFRSLVVALVSILLNLLSVGAAYGLLTLVFLHGVGADLLGFRQVPAVEAWVPLFLFSVLFALSMDYQVFLMSRIKERYEQHASTREAVLAGVASTARIITGAALIIVVVFASFARGELVMFQQMGFGVAVALLLDATLIRSIVLPSTLALLSNRSWYLPRWLHWLPHTPIDTALRPATTAPEA